MTIPKTVLHINQNVLCNALKEGMTMKFKEYFAEVQDFTAGLLVVSGEYKPEEAKAMFEKFLEKSISDKDVESDLVRFGFPPDTVEGSEDYDEPIWYTGAWGKGSKKVWIYRR